VRPVRVSLNLLEGPNVEGPVATQTVEETLGFDHEPTNARQFAVKLTYGSTKRKWIYWCSVKSKRHGRAVS
jgi:hypothetical protein